MSAHRKNVRAPSAPVTAHPGAGRRVSSDARASPCRLAFHSDRCASPSSSSAGGLHHIMTIQGEGHIADCRHSLRSLDGCLLAAFEREEPGHANHGQSYSQTLKPNAERGREKATVSPSSNSTHDALLRMRGPSPTTKHAAAEQSQRAVSSTVRPAQVITSLSVPLPNRWNYVLRSFR